MCLIKRRIKSQGNNIFKETTRNQWNVFQDIRKFDIHAIRCTALLTACVCLLVHTYNVCMDSVH